MELNAKRLEAELRKMASKLATVRMQLEGEREAIHLMSRKIEALCTATDDAQDALESASRRIEEAIEAL